MPRALNLSVAALVALGGCSDAPRTQQYGGYKGAPTFPAAPPSGNYTDPPQVLSSTVYDPSSFAVGRTIHEVATTQKYTVSWYFHPNGYAYVTSDIGMAGLYHYTLLSDGRICLSYTNECLLMKHIARQMRTVIYQDAVYRSGGAINVIKSTETGDPNGIVPSVVNLVKQQQQRQDAEALAMLAVLGAGVAVALAATSGALPDGGGSGATGGSSASSGRRCADGSSPMNGECRAPEVSRPAEAAPAIDPFYNTSPGTGAGGLAPITL